MIDQQQLYDAASKKECRRAAQLTKELLAAEHEILRMILAKGAGPMPFEQFILERIEQNSKPKKKAKAKKEQKPGIWLGWFDGSCNPNPGPMGIGVVILSPDGDPIELSKKPGHGTNNIAEYMACIVAMETALERGATGMFLRGDSQLIVQQVSGVWRVNNQVLIQLHQRACELATQFKEFKISWVPREQNKRADALSTR